MGNHFSCALLFRLQAPDTGNLPFFGGFVLAQVVDKGSKNNAAQEKPTHWETNWSALVSNSTENRNPDCGHILVSRPYFPTLGILHTSLLLTLSLPLFRGGHCWDQAEHTASSCTWSRTKSGGSPHSQLDSEGLSRKARAATSPTYKRIFLARNKPRSRNVSPHTLQAITSATPMSLSTSHLMFGEKKN